MADEPLVPFFVVSLVANLSMELQQKGRRLTEAEVLKIRDRSPCILMPLSQARAAAESRGYEDIDPDRVWEEWQVIREEFELPDKPAQISWWRRLFGGGA